jgi:hypothetical protein
MRPFTPVTGIHIPLHHDLFNAGEEQVAWKTPRNLFFILFISWFPD